jgi:uncharacterized RDD family membrane protein YckC
MMNEVSLLRRFGACSYDAFLAFSFAFFMGLIYIAIFGVDSTQYNHKGLIFYQFYQSFFVLFYFIFPWFKSGQTLGMKVWKVRLISQDNKQITFVQCLVRFFSAIISWSLLGLGFFYALINTKGLTLHDKLSNSYLIKENSVK